MQLYLMVAETVLFLTSFALHNTPPIQATNAPFHFICVQYFSHNEHHVPVGVGAPPLGTQLLLNVSVIHYFKNWNMEEAGFIADFGLVFIAARVYGVQAGCIC